MYYSVGQRLRNDVHAGAVAVGHGFDHGEIKSTRVGASLGTLAKGHADAAWWR